MFNPIAPETEAIGKEIVDIAIKVHKTLGPGLLERIYDTCFFYELNRRGIGFMRQKSIPIFFEELVVEDTLRLDILVADSVIVELKAQGNYHPVWDAQLLSYMHLDKKRLGYILNFHVPLMKQGIKRLIL